MIIESQTLKSKTELQKSVSNLSFSKGTVYKDVDKKGLQEILSKTNISKRVTIIVIDS